MNCAVNAMEFDVSHLARSHKPHTKSLLAVLEGLLHIGALSSQYKRNGRVIPWNSLARYNNTYFPEWENGKVVGSIKLSGDFLFSVDRDFSNELRRFINTPKHSHIVFDLDYVRNSCDIDTVAFMCESGIMQWFMPESKDRTDSWLLSVFDSTCICFYHLHENAIDKILIVSRNKPQHQGYFSQDDKKSILDMFIKHIKWYSPQVWEWMFGEFELLEDDLTFIKKSLGEIYDITYSWGILRLDPKR